MAQMADPESVKQQLELFSTLYASNSFARYLQLRTVDPENVTGPQEKLLATAEANSDDFLAPHFLLARAFRKRGEPSHRAKANAQVLDGEELRHGAARKQRARCVAPTG